MIVEFGHFALVLAFCFATVQGLAVFSRQRHHSAGLVYLISGAALSQAVLAALAFAALVWAYIQSDFSVRNVFENSHSLKPMLYKVTGVWGNHEGSMLLWILVLALFGVAVAFLGRELPRSLRLRVLAVQGLIAFAFLAFLLFLSNPFLRLDPAPLEGRDLNPLLQDPGLAFHPPFLYLGYVGFSLTFAFAIAALLDGRIDQAWARWVRPWTLVAWSCLTVGIALGSWWAYYELGWGGWWFWDPVENASLLPWLAGTALLHSVIVTERRGALKSWTVLLAVLAFSLSLLGTFLVRSGVLTSVHAFANDPERGTFILLIMAITVGGALVLYAWRAPGLMATGFFAPISRETALVLNNLLLVTGCLTVLTGTLYPLFLDITGGGKISVGPPYFELTFVPLMIPLLLALAPAPLLAWKRADLAGVLWRLRFVGILALTASAALWWWSGGSSPLPALGMALAIWIVLAVFLNIIERLGIRKSDLRQVLRRARGVPRSVWGMSLAHIGVAVLVAGITASSSWRSEVIRSMFPGEMQEMAGYVVKFEGAETVAGPNYSAQRGIFPVMSGERTLGILTPERRIYPVQGVRTTEAAIRTTMLADLYIVLGAPLDDGSWTVRLYHNPLVPWIWFGCILMALGGCTSILDRRRQRVRRASVQ